MRIPSCLLALPSAMLVAAGCASAPTVPVADLTQAHTLVAQAQQSEAPRYDSVDLASAQDKLAQADANAKDRPVLASQLAQEASADASLALARTRAAKEQEALAQVNASLTALHSQLQQSADSAESAPAPDTAPAAAPGSTNAPQGVPQP